MTESLFTFFLSVTALALNDTHASGRYRVTANKQALDRVT